MKIEHYRNFILGGMALCSVALAKADEWVRFAKDSQTIIVDAPELKAMQGPSSAVYKLGDKHHRVGTQGYQIINPLTQTTVSTPFGEAEASAVTYGDDRFQYTLTLKRLKDQRAFTLQAVFHNLTDSDVNLNSFDLFNMQKNAGGQLSVTNPSEWLVTPLMQSIHAEPLDKMKERLKEAAMIYNAKGEGFLMGPVGPAEAHCAIDFRNNQPLKMEVVMDSVLVRAGESRRSEEMIISFESAESSIDMWTKWVAITHGVRRHKGPVYGWCSWYDRTTKIDAKHVLEVTKTIDENPNTFGKGIIQIDDGYQKMDGDWSGNEKFPMGMAAVAKTVRDAGCIPGVWFAPLMINPEHPWVAQNPDAIQRNAKGIESFMNPNPFHPGGAKWVNPDHPETKKYLYNIIKDARDRGFGYIKIDFNGIGQVFVDPTKTRLQVFRELYTLYREAAGDEMYILSCLGQPTRGVIGFIDAARIGPDSHPAHFNHCLESVLRFQIFDNVWWQNDPDVSYLAPKLESRRVGYTPQGEGMWKSWHNINALVGGTAMISEPINMPDVKAVWRNYEIMRPGSREPAKLLTLGKSAYNTTLGFAAEREFGNFAVYNLYNEMEGANALSLDFEEAGLPTGVKCAVFDFWKNEVIGYATDSYTTEKLDHLSSALLRFTPITSDRAALVGSNLHLSIGATEINDIRVSPSKIVVELSDAGAQEGALTFYSKQAIAPLSAENCKVTSVKNLGNDLWQVNIAGRQWNTKQSIELKLAGAAKAAPAPKKVVKSETFIRLDADQSGEMTLAEYINPVLPGLTEADKNSDGFLTLDEFPHEGFFKDTDKNGDNKLSMDELKKGYKKQFDSFDKDANGILTPNEI